MRYSLSQVKIRRSWQKYIIVSQSLEALEKKKGSEDKFNFELLRNEIDCTREGINDGENESSDGDIFFS